MPDRLCLLSPIRVHDGRLVLPQKGERFRQLLKTMPNCVGTLRIEQFHDPISDQLRAFYWGVVIKRVVEDTGYTEREAHELLKELHMPIALATVRGRAKFDGLRVLESSLMALSGREAWDYVERIQRWGAQLDEPILIPDPNQGMVVAA